MIDSPTRSDHARKSPFANARRITRFKFPKQPPGLFHGAASRSGQTMPQIFVLALVAVAVAVPVAVPIDAFLADKAGKQRLKQALPSLQITPQSASASANRSR